MKNLFIFLIIPLVFIGCNSDDDTTMQSEEVDVTLLGTWKLIEVREGNDTGTSNDELFFEEVDSEKTITFNTNGVISSNSNVLCLLSQFMGEPTSGFYNLVDSTYVSEDCFPFDEYNFPFVQTDSTLVVSYIYNGISEGKFKKVADLD